MAKPKKEIITKDQFRTAMKELMKDEDVIYSYNYELFELACGQSSIEVPRYYYDESANSDMRTCLYTKPCFKKTTHDSYRTSLVTKVLEENEKPIRLRISQSYYHSLLEKRELIARYLTPTEVQDKVIGDKMLRELIRYTLVSNTKRLNKRMVGENAAFMKELLKESKKITPRYPVKSRTTKGWIEMKDFHMIDIGNFCDLLHKFYSIKIGRTTFFKMLRSAKYMTDDRKIYPEYTNMLCSFESSRGAKVVLTKEGATYFLDKCIKENSKINKEK